MLAFLLIGTAYSEPQANKPYKVCPEVAKLKDYPCVAMGPVATIVSRMEKEDPRDKELARLKEENAELRKLLDSQFGKTDEPKQAKP